MQLDIFPLPRPVPKTRTVRIQHSAERPTPAFCGKTEPQLCLGGRHAQRTSQYGLS